MLVRLAAAAERPSPNCCSETLTSGGRPKATKCVTPSLLACISAHMGRAQAHSDDLPPSKLATFLFLPYRESWEFEDDPSGGLDVRPGAYA